MRIDGVDYTLDWGEFTVGSSFFIPCLNDTRARQVIEAKLKRLKYRFIIKLVVEDGVRGLRVWRVDRYNRLATP